MDNNGQNPIAAPVNPAPVQNSAPITPGVPEKKSKTGLIVAIVILVVVLPLVVMVAFAAIFVQQINKVFTDASTMVCKADSASITINYDNGELVGYSAVGVDYDLSSEQKKVESMGLSSYLESYAKSFTSKTKDGYCEKNGITFMKSGDNDDSDDSGNTLSPVNNSVVPKGVETQTIGTDEFGYIQVPSDWNRFVDPDAPNTYQYSHGYSQIVTMFAYIGAQYQNFTPELASQMVYDELKDEEDVDLISRQSVYIANKPGYLVKVTYDNDYVLIMYYFTASDGYVHYISLESTSQSELDEVDWIVDTFKLNK